MMRSILTLLIYALIYVGPVFADTTDYSNEFPVDAKLRIQVDFWKKVYTRIEAKQAFLHDVDDLSVIYETIDVPNSRRSRIHFVRARKAYWKNKLYSLYKSDQNTWSEEQEKFWEKIGKPDKSRIRAMMHNIRYQQGMRDRYLVGYKRGLAFKPEIRKILKQKGIPEIVAYLPHVESSFNYKAYSKVGAAGMWQFMRYTARRYGLKMNYLVDKRRDPFKAAYAAAELIRTNYELLETWPLALTAYNHGAASLKRAIAELGTRDISEIIQHYEGRRFGFASKNFYATFMATVEISENFDKYFNEVANVEEIRFHTIKIPHALTLFQISKALDISLSRSD